MATRFYLRENLTPVVNPAVDAGWETSASPFARRRMLPYRDSADTLTSVGGFNSTTGQDACHRQFVSDELVAGQVFNNSVTYKAYVQTLESGSNDNIRSRLNVRVVSRDGGTVRHTALTIADYSTGAEWVITTVTNKSFADGDAGAAGPYVTVDGDRLVVEIGHNDSAGTGIIGTSRWGSSGTGGFLAENETDTGTTLNPWFELSLNLSFSAEPTPAHPYLMTLNRHSRLGPPMLMFPPTGGFFVNTTTTPQSLTATATTTATMQLTVGKIMSGTSTTTATILKSVGKILTATSISTATIVKSVGTILTATSTTTATMLRSVGKTLTATATTTASILTAFFANPLEWTKPLLMTLRRRLGPPHLHPQEPVPASVTQFQQILTATSTTTATIVKSVGKTLTATSTTTATMLRSIGKILTATSVSTATILKSVGKTLTATATTTATIIKSVGKILTATSVTTATMLRSVGKILSATSATTATMLRSVAKTLTATATSTATMVRSIGKILTATATSTASLLANFLSAPYEVVKPLLIRLNLHRQGPPLVRGYDPPPPAAGTVTQQILTATATVTASIARVIGKTVSATATSNATIVKSITKTLTATGSSTASLVKSVGVTLSAAASSTATISRQIGKTLSATSTVTASISAIFQFAYQRILSMFGNSPSSDVGSLPSESALGNSPQSDVESTPMEEPFDRPNPESEVS